MAKYATDDLRWDAFTLILVLRANLSKVFAKRTAASTSDHDAKALVTTLLQVFERRNMRGHGQNPTEAESLDVLSNMEQVLGDCQMPDAAASLQKLRVDAQGWVEEARAADEAIATAADSGEGPLDPVMLQLPMEGSKYHGLVLYRAMAAFEDAFAVAVREPGATRGNWYYQDGSITLGNRPGSALHHAGRKARIKGAAPALELIASARHWLFHNTGADIDVPAVLCTTGTILHQFEGIALPPPATLSSGDGPPTTWTWNVDGLPSLGGSTVEVPVALSITGHGMRIPMSKERCLVGRDDTIKSAVSDLLKPNARVLIYGDPGVGKDVVAAEVVQDPEIQNHPELRLQAWLQGSTDAGLRRQLVDVFKAQHPSMLAGLVGVDGKESEMLARIKVWLATHPTE